MPLLLCFFRAVLLCLAHPAHSQEADVAVSIVDVSDQDVFVNFITASEALPGLVWLYLTAPGVEPTAAEMKLGTGAVGPASCRDMADAATLPDETFGLVFCNLPYGGEYTLQVLFEGNGTRLVRQNLTVPVEPSPLPTGPYCFDIDFDYSGATVLENTTAASAVACQALCAASADCLHFRFVYDPLSPDFQLCDLLSSGPLSGSASPASGRQSGPKSCDSRAVLYFRPRGNLYETAPTPIVRGIPFTLSLKGEHFDTSHDRVVALSSAVQCGQALPALSPNNYAVMGTSPSTWAQWLALPCNNSGSAPELMICGSQPDTVLFDDLGPFRLCACDAGGQPFGCEFSDVGPEAFNVRVTVDTLEVIGPYANNVVSCPAGRECTITGLQGYLMRSGDKIMLRENCSSLLGSPDVVGYTGPSRPSPNPSPGSTGSDYIFDSFNTATCPVGHEQGPCLTARICYCAAHSGSTHPCLLDTDFQVDAGEVRFYGPPGVVGGHAILQEDFESFTLRWNYPADDGGGAVRNYNLFFRLCPGGNYSDGVESEYIVPVAAGENQHGVALNATFHFRAPIVGAVPEPIVAATRYCVVVLATNDAATGRRDIATEFVWVTDVYPPKDLAYPAAPLYLVKGEAMTPLIPTVTTADCSSLKSVANTVPQYTAQDCRVQHFDIYPPLPDGLTLDAQTGVVSGTPAELLMRPEIFLVTATNGGGKTSAYISLAVIDNVGGSFLSSCLQAPTTGELVLSFSTPSEADAPWLQAGSMGPQVLRLKLLQPLLIALRRTSGAALDTVSRAAAVGCGEVVLDAVSDDPEGFPPPTLCHWADSRDLSLGASGAVGARLDLQFQGNATFRNARVYQMALRARLSHLAAAGDQLLQLTLFASEGAADERGVDSEAFGSWTGVSALPRAVAALDTTRSVPLDLPVTDAPWSTGRPVYVAGFGNPLFGEVPDGLPYPEGFPAPGPLTCTNFSSYCATAPHQYVNKPSDTAWYQDTDPDSGLFPSFAVFTSTATLLAGMQSEMQFNPFGVYTLTALDSFAGIQADRYLSNRLSVQLDFALSPDISGALTLEQFIAVCPSSSLRTPLSSLAPVCSVLSGPSFVTCDCDPTLPASFALRRCDRLRLRVNAGGDLRAEITATFRVSAGEDWWPGQQPTRWYVQMQTEHGGLNSFRKVSNAGFTAWHDALLTSTTPELCAAECLTRRGDPATYPTPCNAFKFQTSDQDCYLTSTVESTATPLQTPLFAFDYYEYQEQIAYAVETADVVVAGGRFISAVSLQARTYLTPPEPSAPPYDVPHFFPSYVAQAGIVCRLELTLAVPIHGQDNWASSLEVVPPVGFRSVALSPLMEIPTPQGRGVCPSGRRCRWLLAPGQVLWPGRPYSFDVAVRNPPEPRAAGELWTLFVATSGFGGAASESVSVLAPHPLPVEGHLTGCSVQFNDPSYMPSSGLTTASLDFFLVLGGPRPALSTLRLRVPEAFPRPSACEASPLTPWLRRDEVSCDVGSSSEFLLRFLAPLEAGASVGLRLTEFPLPSSFDAVHPGALSWLAPVEPMSLNVRLEFADQGTTDACHPKVWSCGLEPSRATPRPSQYRFNAFTVELSGAEPLIQPSAWALLRFEVNTSISLNGELEDVLLITLPYGFSFLGIFSSSLQVLRRLERSGQLNLPEAVGLEAAALPGSGTASVLRVTNLYGAVVVGQEQYVNLSFAFPESGVEPSLFDPLTRTPNRSACANTWGISIEAQGYPKASAFAHGVPLALVEQLQVDCSTRAASEGNVLSVRFRVADRTSAWRSSLPEGSSLILAFSFSQLFDLLEPSPAATFAAPGLRATENGTTLERRMFTKLGCPPMALFSLDRRFRQELPECAVLFDNFQDETQLLLNASGLVPGAAHEVQIRLRNPRTQLSPDLTLHAFRSRQHLPFRLIPLPLVVAASQGALLPMQQPLRSAGCGEVLPAMEAEVFAALCSVPGLTTEVTLGFVAPLVLAAPVAASLQAPPGYRLGPVCNFEASQLQLPGGRTLEFLLAGFFADCFVHADGRTISFNITRNIQALTSWTFFTIHAVNPLPEELPFTPEQSTWRLEVGGFAAAGALRSPALRSFQALELRELPFMYDATTRPLLLRFRSSAVPAGGYVVLYAPAEFSFPDQCQASVQSLPALPEQPFRPLTGDVDLVTSCSVDAPERALRVALIAGSLPAGTYELRFVVQETSLFDQSHTAWRLESWQPAAACASCCPARRANFRDVIGLSSIEQLDVAVFYAELPGRFRSSAAPAE